jgi:hypothetical protein
MLLLYSSNKVALFTSKESDVLMIAWLWKALIFESEHQALTIQIGKGFSTLLISPVKAFYGHIARPSRLSNSTSLITACLFIPR